MAKQDKLLVVQHPIVIGRIFNSREKSASGARHIPLDLANLHISSLRVITKKGQPGKMARA